MRVVDAAALTTAALLLSSMASAQGIGDLAAKEREKRKSAPAPVKVITEKDLATHPAPAGGESYSGVGVAAAPGTTNAAGAPAGTPADAAATGEKKPPTLEEQMKADEEERQKAEAAWRQQADATQKEVSDLQENVGRLTIQLNDFRYGFNTPSVARAQSELDEAKTKLADAQSRLEALQDQARREGYR